MKRSQLAATLIFLLLFTKAYSQTLPTVKGAIRDSEKSSVEFVNVVLLNAKDSSLYKGAITDASGSYAIEHVKEGAYLLMASFVGYEKKYSDVISVNTADVNVPEITLVPAAVNLKETNVTAQRPFLEHKVDRTVVNVENSIVNAGATALEVLTQSPGVTVDNQGNVSLQGKQGVLITIDDKPSYLSSQDLYNMLRNMPSDQLSQVELITNPSSKYDAAGNSGIINLKLRKKQNLGMNGSARLSYGQGAYPDFGTGINLNYRNEQFNLFGGYDYTYGFYYTRTELTRRFQLDNMPSSFNLKQFDKGYYITNTFRVGMDYFLNSKHTIGVLVKGNSYRNHDNTSNNTDIRNTTEAVDSSYFTSNISDTKFSNITSNLNYRFAIDTLGSELSADVDYVHFDNQADFKFETYHTSPNNSYKEITTAIQPATIEIKTGKIDYTKPIGKKMKIETGIKTSFVTTDNDVKYYNYADNVPTLDTTKTNNFIYRENINAAYANWNVELKKLSIQLGLRAEQTISEGDQKTTQTTFDNDYIDLFPSTFFSYNFNDKNQSKVSYSRRIDRPAYQQLNPFRYFIDPYNYEEGNPFLSPQFTNAFEVGHTYMKAFTLSLKYSHTTNAMTQIAKQIDSTRTTFTTTENLDTRQNYGIALNAPIPIASWWNSSNNVNVFNSSVRGMSSGGEIDKELTSYIINSYNSFTLPHKWGAELSGNYYSKVYYGTMLVNARFSINAGFRKTFLNDRWTLRVNVNDIFHTDVTKSKIQYQNIDVDYYSIYDSQFVRFHLMYNFGKKTVARARQHTIGSEEEGDRIRTGR